MTTKPEFAWQNYEKCYYSVVDGALTKVVRLAMFDFDNCLVETFTSTPMTNVISVLRTLSRDHDIAIISNQKGISKGKTTHEAVRLHFQEFSDVVNEGLDEADFVHMSVFYSTNNDYYRKPHTYMYELLLSELADGYEDDSIFYCGDAAGRPARKGRRKDFANSDLLFAYNCNIPFRTPEEVFLGEKPETLINPATTHFPAMIKAPELPKTDKPKVVILVGPQGSGKSALAKKWADESGMTVVSQDVLKTKARVFRAFTTEINKKETRGVIIDNTNRDVESRDKYIDAARSKDFETICVWWNIPKELSFHMCEVRVELGGKSMAAPAIHIYYKNLEAPEAGEYDYFTELNSIIRPDPTHFESESYRRAYNMRFK